MLYPCQSAFFALIRVNPWQVLFEALLWCGVTGRGWCFAQESFFDTDQRGWTRI